MFKLTHTCYNFALKKSQRMALVLKCLYSTSIATEIDRVPGDSSNDQVPYKRHSNALVAAAFAALETPGLDAQVTLKDEKFSKALTVDELLSVCSGGNLSREHALKVVFILGQWVASGHTKLQDFESDSRFLRICRILSKPKGNFRWPHETKSEDLSTVLSVTADDEAAKLVGSITLPQMVKVMSTLAIRKRRSTLLLRTISYHIAASIEPLDVKQASDLLYSVSILNFIDENLFNKISRDICADLNKPLKSSAVVGSMLTSFGILRYKNNDVLEALCEWTLKNHSICRPQDIYRLFITLATLNYLPRNKTFFETLVPALNIGEAKRKTIWLDVVWSLVLLNQATSDHISSVLCDNFVNNAAIISNSNSQEERHDTNMTTKLKLLNVNAAANHLFTNYNGPRLQPTSNILNIQLQPNKEKMEGIETIVSTLKNLIQSEENYKVLFNTGMGFLIDVKCLLDNHCHSVPLTLHNESRNNVNKIAIMSFEFHDYCIGQTNLTGINSFIVRLLEAQGYKVIDIPYTDFKRSDKLVQRVKYLEERLKRAVNITRNN